MSVSICCRDSVDGGCSLCLSCNWQDGSHCSYWRVILCFVSPSGMAPYT